MYIKVYYCEISRYRRLRENYIYLRLRFKDCSSCGV